MVIHLFGDNLRELRKKKNISQETIGKLCGVAKNTVSNWENNINKPDIELVKIIAHFFGVSTDYLLGVDNDKIEKLKIACQENGLMLSDDFTIKEFEKALMVMEMLKEKK